MNSKSFSLIMQSNILSVIMIIFNQKLMSRIPILISRKTASINDEIDKLRHSATSSLFERNDVLIVASVSCIYGLGSPEEYREHVVSLRVGMEIGRNELLRKFVDIQYERNDISFTRGTFRVRGDVVELFPASRDEHCIRIEFFGDEIERIREVDALTGEITR